METVVVGHVTADATAKTISGDMSVVNFDIAVNDYFRKKGATDSTQRTTYVQCAYWNRPGIAPFLKKGTLVELSGRIGTRGFMANDGTPKAVLTLVVEKLKLHGNPSNSKAKGNTETVPAEITEPLEDLPF